MELRMFRVDEIIIPENSRPINPKSIEKIKKSLLKVGVINAPTVTIMDGVPVLLDGQTRVEATKALGWYFIACYIKES